MCSDLQIHCYSEETFLSSLKEHIACNWARLIPLVLRSLTQAPYEPIEQSNFTFLSHKTTFLLAICSTKRVSELHAVSVCK